MSGHNQDIYRFGKFRLSPSHHALYLEETEILLAPKSFEVLLYLARNPGRLVTKEELLKAVWQDAFIEEANLAQQIFRLRKAFETEPEAANLIRTIPGRGYQFTADVSHELHPTFGSSAPTGYAIGGWRERTRVVIEELAVDQRPSHQPALSTPQTNSRNRAIAVTATVIALASLSGWGWRHHAASKQSSQVVIADFLNTTGDPNFDHTLNRALEIDLSQSPYMDVLSEREAVNTLGLMGQRPDSPLTDDLARQICIRTNRQALLTGSISGLGHDYVLTLEATDCNSGKQLTAAKTEAGSKEKVLAALDSLADRVRSKLGEASASVEKYQVPVEEATTPSLDALKAYSTAASLVARGAEERESIAFYQKAIELDPNFAMAYGGLGTMYFNLSEYKLSHQYYIKAFALSNHVSEKEKLIIRAHYFMDGENDIESGINTYQMWTVTYPRDWIPFLNLSTQYILLGQYASAVEAGKHALELQPNRAITYSVYARALSRMARFTEAKAIGQQAIQNNKDNAGLHGTLFGIAIAENDQKAIVDETAWAAKSSDEWYRWYFLYCQAEVASAAGKFKLAEQLFKESTETARKQKSVESADGVLLDEAHMELDFGQPAMAKATLDRIANQDSDEPDLSIMRVQLGDITAANRYLATHAKENPASDFALMKLPRVRAALALAKGKPLEAITALDPIRPYELATYDPLSERAAIYLATKNGGSAEQQYKTILANPGINPLINLYNLAHLGLARAYALQHKTAQSRQEYETVFALWKDADPDLPLLKQARQEYAQLKSKPL